MFIIHARVVIPILTTSEASTRPWLKRATSRCNYKALTTTVGHSLNGLDDMYITRHTSRPLMGKLSFQRSEAAYLHLFVVQEPSPDLRMVGVFTKTSMSSNPSVPTKMVTHGRLPDIELCRRLDPVLYVGSMRWLQLAHHVLLPRFLLCCIGSPMWPRL